MYDLDQISITELKGIGVKVAERLAKLEILTLQDALFHFPLKYQDRTRIYPIQDILPGQYATIQGEVLSTQVIRAQKSMLVAQVSDGTGTIAMKFFYFAQGQQSQLSKGTTVKCFGEVRQGKQGIEIIHPEYRLVHDEITEVEETLTPIYPTTQGLTQHTLRKITDQSLVILTQKKLTDYFPELTASCGLSFHQAIHLLHRPTPDIATELLEQHRHPAQIRLIIEELAAHHLSLRQLKQQHQQHLSYAIPPSTVLIPKLLSLLPFSPTKAQAKVVIEIEQDLQQAQPMLRLVQGDVGSGKTLVALMAALTVIEKGWQVALMAPTELLAEQHFSTLSEWLTPMAITTVILTGKTKTKQRQQTLAAIVSGEAQLIIGTHALFQQDIEFEHLHLIIIDEQHRFGVHQRLLFREKGMQKNVHPHQLVMTATPIPRTLAMTSYADLDLSVIDELPPGRTPITTVAIANHRRMDVVERVRNVCQQESRQVYWICPLISESDVLQCQAAEAVIEELTEILPEVNIGLVHGRLKSDEKSQVMKAFKDQQIQLLVATTVIEVGVDVPNASLMIIENPERLGLAQLHQLRGRVGRGSIDSHCVLLYQPPLSKNAQKRIQAIRSTNDGFKIAQYDLEIRGAGEILGTRQTGLTQLKIADLIRDHDLITQVQTLTNELWQQHPHYIPTLIQRWLGNKAVYSNT